MLSYFDTIEMYCAIRDFQYEQYVSTVKQFTKAKPLSYDGYDAFKTLIDIELEDELK